MDWKQHFCYSPEIPNGIRWARYASNNRVKIGWPAGSRKYDKGNYYYQVKVLYENYQNHRVIWEMFNGPLSSDLLIDHIDGNPSNNVIENLRPVDQRHNSYNCKASKNNKSSVNGVHLKNNGRGSYYWCAQWNDLNGKRTCKNFSIEKYGNDTAFNLAVEARIAAENYLKLNGINISERHGT